MAGVVAPGLGWREERAQVTEPKEGLAHLGPLPAAWLGVWRCRVRTPRAPFGGPLPRTRVGTAGALICLPSECPAIPEPPSARGTPPPWGAWKGGGRPGL